MLHDIVKKDSTSRSVTLKIVDSTDGTPETAVAYNTSGIDLWYRREGAAKVSITEATLAALTTAWASGGFLAISDGYYRLDLPDAAFATGANYVDFGGTVTGMIVIGGRVKLVNFDFEDAVRGGLTALPNAAAAASGGLLINGSNTGTVTLSALTVTGVTTHTGNVVLSDGLTISAPSTSNRAGLTITGNGSGAGIIATGGATGDGVKGVGGGTSGSGIKGVGTAGNYYGLEIVGQGSGCGAIITGGATGDGLKLVGGGTSGNGFNISATVGHGINVAAAGASKHGIFATGGTSGTSDGMKLVAGTGGVDLRAGLASTVKRAQALPNFEFLMTDSTTHAPATGATVTVTRSIDGGAFGAGTLGSVAEVGVGVYKVDIGTGDLTGTVMTLRATATGCDDMLVTFLIEQGT